MQHTIPMMIERQTQRAHTSLSYHDMLEALKVIARGEGGRLPFAPEIEEGADESASLTLGLPSLLFGAAAQLQGFIDLALLYGTTAS